MTSLPLTMTGYSKIGKRALRDRQPCSLAGGSAERNNMSHLQVMLWFCVGAYGIHVLEEFVFDWKNWARQVLHLPVVSEDFYLTNCLVIVVGIVAVWVAPEYPAIATSLPALMLINGILMHIFPFLLKRGRFSPGLITAVLLFLPLGVNTIRVGHLDTRGVLTSFIVGALLLATPIGFFAA